MARWYVPNSSLIDFHKILHSIDYVASIIITNQFKMRLNIQSNARLEHLEPYACGRLWQPCERKQGAGPGTANLRPGKPLLATV